MKFSNGLWPEKEGYQVFSPKEVYSADITENSITIYAPYVHVAHRGNTTDGGLMTITLRALASNVISVSVTNHKGSRKKDARFAIASRPTSTQVYETEDTFVLASGSMEAHISKASWQISYYHDSKLLTSTSAKSLAYILDSDDSPYIRERLDLGVGELVYGLGERFTSFVKNGQSIDCWNNDGGTDSEQAYKNIPFYVTSKGYGVFVNSARNVSLEVACECASKVQFSVPGEELEYFIIGGESLKHVISTYTELTGRPALVPAWSFGLWLSTSFTTDYSEETVMHFIDTMLENDIPISVFHFDCYWMKGFEWTNFTWDRDNFPDPAGMIRRIHAKGIKVCVWINPYIAQKSKLFEEGLSENYFVNTGDGDVWQWDRWQAGMALVDFTNVHARGWYQKYLEELIKMGVDSFKTDFGERIPVKDSFYGAKANTEGISYANGATPESMHNYYTYLYNQAVFELLERKLGKNQACLFARSATVGCQKFPLHWGGDCLSSYPSMAESLRGGLSLALCGFGFWSHDIGGFESGCTPDIYKRWTAFGLLSSHSRYHGNSEYKVPWLYDDEAVEVTRLFTHLKLGMMPYIFAAAIEASATGIPVMRPMFLEFPDDETCKTLDRQYMFGSSLLVAPILSSEGEVTFYVPKGRWTNLLTQEVLVGPQWFTQTHDYFSLPLLVRENTILITGKSDDTPEYDYLDSVTISLFELADGSDAFTEVFSSTGTKAGTVRAFLRGKMIIVETEGFTGFCRLFLTNQFRVKSCSAGMPEVTKTGTVVVFDGQRVDIELL